MPSTGQDFSFCCCQNWSFGPLFCADVLECVLCVQGRNGLTGCHSLGGHKPALKATGYPAFISSPLSRSLQGQTGGSHVPSLNPMPDWMIKSAIFFFFNKPRNDIKEGF